MKFKPSPKRKEKSQQKEKSGIRTKLNFILKRKAPPKETKNQLPVEINKAALTFKEFYPVHAPFGYVGIEADERTGKLQYLVIEPTMNSQEQEALEEIKKHLKTEIVVPLDVLHDEKRTDEFLSKHIQKVIRKFKLAVSSDAVNKFLYYVKRDFLGYGAIDILMRDQNIEDVSCNGTNVPVYVWHRKYESLKTNIIYPSHEELDAFITRLAYKTGHQISVARPILEGTLPEGFRAHLTLDEVSKRGDTFTIRKVKADPYTIVDLLKFGTTSPQMGAYFWVLIENLRSIMVAGATASGKTAFLNAIGMFIKPEMKVVTIEEVREIRLHDNWIPMVARPSFQAGVQEVTLYDLLKSSLRQRPDYIVVGEVRGEEAYTLFQSIAVGHGGLCTIHSESVETVVKRLLTQPMNIPPMLIPLMNVIVHIGRTKRGNTVARRAMEVAEITDINQQTGAAVFSPVFKWNPKTDAFDFTVEDPRKDFILQKIASTRYIPIDDLVAEIERRSAILKWMVKKNIHTYDEVAKVVREYYVDPARVLNKVGLEGTMTK